MKKIKPITEDLAGAAFVPLTKGAVALIDLVDAEWARKYNWHLMSGGYAARREPAPDRQFSRLHREILIRAGVDLTGLHVDHVDGNRLNNRRNNLRLATVRENGQNRRAQRNNTLGIKGVFRHECGKYCAQINHQHLGLFDTPEEAKAAYNAAALKYHGEFARLNP